MGDGGDEKATRISTQWPPGKSNAAANRSAAFQLGIALDGTSMAFMWEEATAIRSVSAPCDGTPDSIKTAIAELAEGAPAVTSVMITLRRPLAHMRTVHLGAITDRAMAEGMLARYSARYVMMARPQEYEVSARALPLDRWCAAFAPSEVLEALVNATEEQGWHEVVIGTSDDALSTAVLALTPVRSMTSFIAVVCSDAAVTDAVIVRGGAPMLGRRFLENATVADLVAFIENGESEFPDPSGLRSIVVVGTGRYGHQITGTLGKQGVPADMIAIFPPLAALPSTGSPLDTIAAAGRLRGVRLPLSFGKTRARFVKSMRPVTYGLALALAAAMIASVVLWRWEMNKKLGVIRTSRADVAAQVRLADDLPPQVTEASSPSATLAERERDAARVAATLAAVTGAVPRTTSLQSLSIAGDSVLLEGDTPQLSDLIDALRSVPIIERVHFAAPTGQAPPGRPLGRRVARFIVSAHIRGPVSKGTD